MVAAEDNTAVAISPAEGVSVDGPDLPTSLNFNLNAGGSRRFFARGSLGASSPSDFLITANGPILLAQWLDCEPGLAWGIDTRLSATPLSFTLPLNFEHEVVVVKKAGTSLTLDGRPLPEERFTLVSPQGPFEAIRLSDVEVGTCADYSGALRSSPDGRGVRCYLARDGRGVQLRPDRPVGGRVRPSHRRGCQIF